MQQQVAAYGFVTILFEANEWPDVLVPNAAIRWPTTKTAGGIRQPHAATARDHYTGPC